MPKFLWRRFYHVLFFLLVASCSGGGCSSGCASCGIMPLPAGFPKAQTIQNAASVRLSRSGLDFLGTNLGPIATKVAGGTNGEISFNIPASTSSTSIGPFSITMKICPNGPKPSATPKECIADVKLGGAKLRLDAATYATANNEPAIRISGTIPLRVQNLPVNVSLLGDSGIGVGTAGSPTCNGDTPNFDYFDFPIEVILPLVSENIAPRDGYTKVDTKNAVINPTISSNNIYLCKNCGTIFSTICNSFLNWVKGLVFNSIKDPLVKQLKDTLDSQLCTAPNPAMTPQCPTGTQPSTDGKRCVYTSDPNTCVPTMLGFDGHMDLGAFLAGFSPGASGGLDLVLAAGGDMIPSTSPGVKEAPDGAGHTNNGMTLTMLGGALPTPQSNCVPLYDAKIPTGIPVPDEQLSNTLTPWPATTPGPHMGIALAGRYVDYTLAGVYNSGLLCLGITTEQVPQLQSSLVSILIPSMQNFAYQRKPQPIAITTRPQSPPSIKLGNGTDVNTDPHMQISMNGFAIDFYMWSSDRFIRIFTFTSDLVVPINLSTAIDAKTNPNGGLLPAIGNIKLANSKVANADLLLEDGATIAGALQSIIGGLASQFLALSPIDISGALKAYNLGLDIPDGGIRKLTKGSDDFLGIFANLKVLSGTAVEQADVSARMLSKQVWADAMTLTGATEDRSKLPELRMEFNSSLDNGSRAIEYSYAVDDHTHSVWRTGRYVTVKQDDLFFQGKHTLNVWARIKGDVTSQSTQPAQVPFTIDVLPPVVSFDRTADGIVVDTFDYVSPAETLVMRWRANDGAFGEWSKPGVIPFAQLPADGTITVEVKDEEGNVASQSQAIRGKPDPTLGGGSGCGCSSAPTRTEGGLYAFAIAIGIAVSRRRKEKKRPFGQARAAGVALGTLAILGATNPGCNCGDTSDVGLPKCGPTCDAPCLQSLPQGLIGSYTSVATAKDGTVWVAGYNEAVYDEEHTQGMRYGDLVAGKWDGTKKAVVWEDVDGLPPPLPDGQCPENDPKGWRGGLTDSGDDVGLWTSMAVDDGGRPMVAYYDATNLQAKIATRDGDKWQSYVLSHTASADVGRYIKIILVNKNPVVAFLAMEKGKDGHTKSRVVVGRSKNSFPMSAGDWTFEDAAVDETAPCRAQFCDSTQACAVSTGTCLKTATGCTPADCGTGKACVDVAGKATCESVIASGAVETYPTAYGVYISLANGPNGLGIALYDRYHGNLVGLSNAGGKWTATILDGETGTRPTAKDTGDVGIAASLAITSNGDWHISYVNGITEVLQYVLWPGGAGAPPKPEIVDDGYDAGKPFIDGKHIIGDDSAIEVDSGGNVRVVYQDATKGTLRYATGTPSGPGVHKWTQKSIGFPASSFGGFFPRFVTGTPQVATWWRTTDKSATCIGDAMVKGEVIIPPSSCGPMMTGNVSIVTP